MSRLLLRFSEGWQGEGGTVGGNRTPNLRIWNPLLYQLSYDRKCRKDSTFTGNWNYCDRQLVATWGDPSQAPKG
jgi:hypothetical protein